jgi:nucleotide-binding universal stress UspA family protein
MNVIGSTNSDKVYEAGLREQFAAITGRIAPKMVEAVIRELEEHFAAMPASKLLKCDKCQGWSSEDLDSCPYCGEGGVVTKDAPPPELDAAPAETEAAPEEPKTEIDATQIEAAAEVVEEKPQKLVKVDRKKNGKGKKKDEPTTDAPAIEVAPTTAFTEKDLDDAIARFQVAAERGADSMYEMGLELRKIRDELWQQRTAEDGKPKYKSFHQFVVEELKVSKDHAYRMVRVVECFSADQFRQYGAGVLKVLVAAPKEDHLRLLEQADKGATQKELAEEVAKVREEKGITTIETGTTKQRVAEGKPLPPTAAAAAAKRGTGAGTSRKPREAAAVTVGLKQEQYTIPLFARPAKPGDETGPARTLADQPWGKIEAMNGLSIFFAVKEKPTGELVAMVTVKKDEDEEKDAAE